MFQEGSVISKEINGSLNVVIDPVKGRGHAIKSNPGSSRGEGRVCAVRLDSPGTEESKSKISFGRYYPNYNTSIKEEGLSNI